LSQTVVNLFHKSFHSKDVLRYSVAQFPRAI